MVKTENPAADRIVAEKWAVWRECFRMAKLLLKESEPCSWGSEGNAKEHYYANVPVLAMALHDQMMGGTSFISQVVEKDQIERYELAMAMVKTMQAANDLVEKKAKKDGHE